MAVRPARFISRIGQNLLFEKHRARQFAVCFTCTISFNPHKNLREGVLLFPFLDGETKAQRGNLPRVTLWVSNRAGIEPRKAKAYYKFMLWTQVMYLSPLKLGKKV